MHIWKMWIWEVKAFSGARTLWPPLNNAVYYRDEWNCIETLKHTIHNTMLLLYVVGWKVQVIKRNKKTKQNRATQKVKKKGFNTRIKISLWKTMVTHFSLWGVCSNIVLWDNKRSSYYLTQGDILPCWLETRKKSLH